MKLLVDANLSPRVAEALRSAGHDAFHVADHGLLTASDETIFEFAQEHAAIVVTADSDFAMLLALRRTESPSVIHLRDVADRGPGAHSTLLIENLGAIEDALTAGAIVSLSPSHLRVRDLPIR